MLSIDGKIFFSILVKRMADFFLKNGYIDAYYRASVRDLILDYYSDFSLKVIGLATLPTTQGS